MPGKESPSNIWLTLRGPEGDFHEAFFSQAKDWQEAIEQIGKLLPKHPHRKDLVVVGFSWRLRGESPLSDSSHFGGVT